MNQFPSEDMGSPRRRSSGSVVVWILLLVFVVPLLLCGGLCGGFLMLGRRAAHEVRVAVDESLHQVEVYELAWQQVSQATEVTSRLGTPVEDDFPSEYQYLDAGSQGGNAEFRYTIRGPKGKAQVHVVGEKIEGQWWYERIDVTFGDGQTVELALDPRPIVLD